MFGVSFGEVVLIAIVALVVVGPRKLPEMLGTAGRWIARLRNMTSEVRRQTGIDEMLRHEGLEGGLTELRSLVRGDLGSVGRGASAGARTAGAVGVVDAHGEAVEYDRQREYPVEGPDCYGAIPEDLAEALDAPPPGATLATPAAPETAAPETAAPEAAAPEAAGGPPAPPGTGDR